MTSRTRKIRKNFTPAQKLEYAKLMVEEHYSNQQVIELSGAGPTAVSRWKKQLNITFGITIIKESILLLEIYLQYRKDTLYSMWLRDTTEILDHYNPELRAKGLSGTHSPHPYIVEYEALVENPYKYEQLAHKKLADFRENEDRGWFKCDLEKGISAIRAVIGTELINEDIKHIDRQKLEGAITQS